MHIDRRTQRIVCAVLWAWFASHVVRVGISVLHSERELRAEARLLLDSVCTMPRGYAVGSSLIRCDEYRAILAAGPVALVVFERTGINIVANTFAAARHELYACLRTIGLAGAIILAILLIGQSMSDYGVAVSRRMYEQTVLSPMRRVAGETAVGMGDGYEGGTKED